MAYLLLRERGREKGGKREEEDEIPVITEEDGRKTKQWTTTTCP